MSKKIAVLTSGGDAPGMNACVRAIVKYADKKGVEVYGVRYGYRGLCDGNLFKMERKDVADIINIGGTFLGTARFDEFRESEVQDKAVEVLKAHGIDTLIAIGGDGTYRGAYSLHLKGIHCIGVPATIDNDVIGTDYCIGFHTALQTITDALEKIRDTSRSHHRCTLVEVMGNQCGDLAIYASICGGAEMAITKDTGYDIDEVIDNVNYYGNVLHKNHAIIVVSEKIADINELAAEITKRTDYTGKTIVLSYIQRGGNPVPFDRILSTGLGVLAVDCALNNESGICLGIQNDSYVKTPIEIAGKEKRKSRDYLYDAFYKTI